jgi:predicted ester cyclase
MCRGLLVANVDDANALAPAALVDRHHVPAGEGEDDVDPLSRDRLRGEPPILERLAHRAESRAVGALSARVPPSLVETGLMASDRILDLLRRPVDPDEYSEIRELWKAHSIAEDNRDLPGLISTLTEDCVYEVMGTGARWEGHEGAARFYTELLTAFPDIHFNLEYIVIGPQGVCEDARVSATHEGRWLDHEPTGERLEWRNAIFFPWDPVARKFKGEQVYTDLDLGRLQA